LNKKKQKQSDIENRLCVNPFRKRRCGKADIETYLLYKGEQLPICRSCWKKISILDWDENDSKEEFVYKPCIDDSIPSRTVKQRKVYKTKRSISKRRKRRKK